MSPLDRFFFTITSWVEELGDVVRAVARPLPRRTPGASDQAWNQAVRELLLSPLAPGDQIAAEAEAWLEMQP